MADSSHVPSATVAAKPAAFPPQKHRNRVVDRSILDKFELGCQHGVGLAGQDAEGRAPCLFADQEIAGVQRTV
ncbi:MAG: hypothetical protein IPP03_15545 [Dechloromonas sp.]|jgi:hypothetical protein|nr:hypothetical protein [Candidatus Dechloromonas phosphoritropha]